MGDRGAGPVAGVDYPGTYQELVLGRLGAVGDLEQQAIDALPLTMYMGERPLATMRFREVEGAPVSALYVSQAAIETLLRSRLDDLDVHVEWNAALANAAADAHGVAATIGDGRSAIATRWRRTEAFT